MITTTPERNLEGTEGAHYWGVGMHNIGVTGR